MDLEGLYFHDIGSQMGFEFDLRKLEFTPSDSPEYHINYNLCIEFISSLNHDVPTAQQFMAVRVTVPQGLPSDETRRVCEQETHAAIERAVISLPHLSNFGRHCLLGFASYHAWRRVSNEPICGYKHLNLDLLVQLDRDRFVFNPSSMPDLLPGLFSTTHDQSCGVAESSVQSLEKHDIDSENSGFPCSICLEDFSGQGCGALRTPCGHVFHGDCIEKWLRVSRHCPLCRRRV